MRHTHDGKTKPRPPPIQNETNNLPEKQKARSKKTYKYYRKQPPLTHTHRQRLPDALCTIPALARLDLSGNPIRQLPAALHRLPLDTLGVTGCPLVGIATDGPTRIRGGWEILTAINEHLKVG